MSNPLAIKMTITSSGFKGEDVNTVEMLNYIKNNNKDIDVYKLEPKTENEDIDLCTTDILIPTIFGAGYDIILLLSVSVDLITIGRLIWDSYKLFVEKHKTKALYFCIGEGENKVEFYLGKDYKNKDIFIKSFKEKASRIIDSDGVKKDYESVTNEIRIQDKWKKI